MGEVSVYSTRVRWLAIATGIASALALFPILFFLYPGLLIVGGIIQPRFPATGRWLACTGVVELLPVLIAYDLHVVFPHPLSQPRYMGLLFMAATALLVWCSVELTADVLRLIRSQRSTPRLELPPVGWVAWVIAGILSVYVGWDGYGLLRWYHHSGGLQMSDAAFYALWMHVGLAIIVITLDVSLVRRVVQLNRG
jgi:hypothetical protein